MDRLVIQGYKSIKDLDIKLAPINIFIGANGSGKSNLLSFFEFLRYIYNQNLREYTSTKGGAAKYLHKGEKNTDEISARIWLDQNGYSFTLKKGEDFFIFVKEGLWYSNNPFWNNPTDIASFSPESTLRFSTLPRARYIRNYLDGLRKYHFHDTGDRSPFNMESNVENDKFFLYDKGQNLAAYLYWIKIDSPLVYNLIVKNIQAIAPYFLDFVFEPEQSGNVKLRWKDNYGDVVYGVNDLSDGTIRFIALVTLFLQPKLPETIIIDEPELGLHPTAIARLAGMIKSASSKGCQVLIATQSTDLISHFEPEDIVTVDQINGESIFRRLDRDKISEWLEEYTIDDLWKRNIIDRGQPNF